MGTTLIFILLTMNGVQGQHATPHSDDSVHMTMEALHAAGGVPPGWKFTLPQGDPASGLEAYINFQCYVCHIVQDVTYPTYPARREPGPDLTGMGAHHPASYFAESIIHPNAVIITGPGYTDSDGLSRMPAYHEMRLGQLIDLVAYLTSLREPGAHKHHGSSQHTEKPSMEHSHDMPHPGSHQKAR